jgi:hypothetical protein
MFSLILRRATFSRCASEHLASPSNSFRRTFLGTVLESRLAFSSSVLSKTVPASSTSVSGNIALEAQIRKLVEVQDLCCANPGSVTANRAFFFHRLGRAIATRTSTIPNAVSVNHMTLLVKLGWYEGHPSATHSAVRL